VNQEKSENLDFLQEPNDKGKFSEIKFSDFS